MHLVNQNILIISNEQWNGLWYSKHNYANALAKNNTVFFLDPPQKWKMKNVFCAKIRKQYIKDNLFLIEYDNILPGNQKNKLLFNINELLIWLKFKKYLKKNNIQKPIFWSFDPYRMVNPKKLKPLLSLYFYFDEYNRNCYLKKLITSVDYVFSTTSYYIKSNVKNKPSLVLGHGLPDDFFIVNQEKTFLHKDYILFAGAVDYRLDYNIITMLIENFPEQKFLIVGPISKSIPSDVIENIRKNKNVYFNEPVKFELINSYISNSKICIAPSTNTVAATCISQKIIQYLAFGKPIVSPLFSGFETMEKNMFYTYKTPEESIEAFKKALNENENDQIKEKRINFAKQHTFSKQIEKIEKFIN